MLRLAFDTSTKWGRFALAEGDQVLADRPLNVSGSYADALLPVIEEMLSGAGREMKDVATVGVTIGPGSFTGVRIGVATAKGLAWGLGCDLVGVTSLEAMAGALLAEFPEADTAVPVLDARRGEVFAGIYLRDGGWVRALAEPAAATGDRWWDKILQTVADSDQAVFGGDGTTLLLGQGADLRPELTGRGTPVLRRWSTAHPATARAMVLALGADLLPKVHPFTLVPEYLRVSDAEVKRRLDLTPATPGDEVTSHRSKRSPR